MISSIVLRNFRSHNELELDFSPNVNVIIGPNGSGKTNILEAIVLLCMGKSFRAQDEAMVRYDQDTTKVIAELAQHSRSVQLRKTHDKTIDKSFIVKNQQLKRLSFQKTLPVVLFEPSFTQIISRGPDQRRDYFDTVLSRTYPGYGAILNKYRLTLAQRNSLLKNLSAPGDQLFVWDIALSELGGAIASHRQQLVNTMNCSLGQLYSHIAGSKHSVRLSYTTPLKLGDYTNSMISGLQALAVRDKERGFTSLGPHREDFAFFINNHPAHLSASRGENRTLLLALKIMEADLIKTQRQLAPILLLDDVFSELDETRQTKLVEYFTDNQVIITSTTTTPLIQGISGKIFEL